MDVHENFTLLHCFCELSGEPNDDDGTENCVEMFWNSGQWNDYFCDQQLGVVCKYRREVFSLKTNCNYLPQKYFQLKTSEST